MIDGYVPREWVFSSSFHSSPLFFFTKFKIPFISYVVQWTIKWLAIRDYPRMPTYRQDSGEHRPTIDRRCIALKKKKDVFLVAAYRGVPLSRSSPAYSYVFTYTTRLSRSPVLFVRRVARGVEGERCGPKKKEKEGDLSSSRNGREPYALSFAFFFPSPRNVRFHETFFWPSIIDLYEVIGRNDFSKKEFFIFSFFLFE